MDDIPDGVDSGSYFIVSTRLALWAFVTVMCAAITTLGTAFSALLADSDRADPADYAILFQRTEDVRRRQDSLQNQVFECKNRIGFIERQQEIQRRRQSGEWPKD